MAVNLHDEVSSNKQKSFFIIVMFFVLIGFIGVLCGLVLSIYYYGGLNLGYILSGLTISLIIAIIYILIFFSYGEKMILKSTGAVEAKRNNYPFLYHTTEALSIAAGMRTPPKCYVIDDSSLNAYATGFKPEKSYVVVTTGLLNKLNRQEIEGVLAHEISHIKNQDIKVMLLAAGLVGATVLLTDLLIRMFIFAPRGGSNNNSKSSGPLLILVLVIGIILLILSPIVAEMIKFSISRKREYLADSTGALLTRYPEGLASALEKIKSDTNPLMKNTNKATAHLFISNPFTNKKTFMSGLFATHPPIDDRIRRLRGETKHKNKN
ncbi:MAG: M48 family metallopeptidase [Nanoarchaeota archaeon]